MKMPKINLLLLFHTLHSLHDILCLFPKLDMYLNPAFSCLKRFFFIQDKSCGDEYVSQFEDGTKRMEAYIKAMEREVTKRKQVSRSRSFIKAIEREVTTQETGQQVILLKKQSGRSQLRKQVSRSRSFYQGNRAGGHNLGNRSEGQGSIKYNISLLI